MAGTSGSAEFVNPNAHVFEAINFGSIGKVPYGFFWLRGNSLLGRPDSVKNLSSEITYCAWYPNSEHPSGGVLIDRTLPADHQYLPRDLIQSKMN